MSKVPQFVRPPFAEAFNAWQAILEQRGLPADVLWVFDENLCFENMGEGGPDRFRLGFQTRFSPVPPDAERIAYGYFIGFEARVVFYRLGTSGDKSVCALLCDSWFETRREEDGFIRQDHWLMSFRPGDAVELEEITDRERWERRILRDRPLHDLDFCMTLRAVHETLAHGRVLTTYERYALRFLSAWRRLMAREV